MVQGIFVTIIVLQMTTTATFLNNIQNHRSNNYRKLHFWGCCPRETR